MKIKKLFLPLSALVLLASCSTPANNDNDNKNQDQDEEKETYAELDDMEKIQYSAGGVIENKLESFEKYKDTESHVKVKNENEFLDAIHNAKNTYTTVLNNDGTLTQTVNEAAKIHIIEIENDLDLGYKLIKDYANQKEYSFVTDIGDFESNEDASKGDAKTLYTYDPLVESGISQIEVSRAKDLLIYSKNGSKITHAGFKINSCNNVAIRNLKFDEMWQWEDSMSESPSNTIGNYDSKKWAYFKVSFSDNVWFDHLEFGKAFDGLVDISNAVYTTKLTYNSAPLNGSGSEHVHFSFCNFKSGSDDQDGYIYKMMSEIEADYQLWKANPDSYQATTDTCRYYRTLRELKASFEDILYGVAMPQKKGFLLGDSAHAGPEYMLTEDTTFVSGKRYAKASGVEKTPTGELLRTKAPKKDITNYLVEGTDYQVGDNISDFPNYSVGGFDVNAIYEYYPINYDYYNNQEINVSYNSCIFKNIEDRIPNTRGGISYIYNSLIDASQYYEYETSSALQLCKNKVGTKVATGGSIYTTNGKYKLALVSQAIISCISGDVYSDTTIYNGIKNLAKNNIYEGSDSDLGYSSDNYDCYNSGYKFNNIVYKYGLKVLSGSTGSTNPFSSVCGATRLSTDYFSFHNDKNELPFSLTRAVDNLTNEESLDMYFTAYPAGTREGINYYLVKY